MTDIKIVCGYVRKVEKLPTLEWPWTLICNAILIHYVNSVCNSWHNYLMVPISRPKITSYATDNYKTLFSKLLTVMPGHNSSICHSKLNTAEKKPSIYILHIYTFRYIYWALYLTHWGRDKMAAVSQTTFSSALSWMKIYEIWHKLHWSLFLRVELTQFQRWYR